MDWKQLIGIIGCEPKVTYTDRCDMKQSLQGLAASGPVERGSFLLLATPRRSSTQFDSQSSSSERHQFSVREADVKQFRRSQSQRLFVELVNEVTEGNRQRVNEWHHPQMKTRTLLDDL